MPSTNKNVPTSITTMSMEVIDHVCDYLDNADIKELRLTCRKLGLFADIRINRIFISPHKKILDTFHNIVHTPRFTRHIKELVWDDSTMLVYNCTKCRDYFKYSTAATSTFQTAFQGCDCNMERLEATYGKDFFQGHVKGYFLHQVDKPQTREEASFMQSQKEAFAVYQQLYSEHELILRNGEDLTALEKGLRLLSKLRFINVSDNLWEHKNYPGTLFHCLLPPELFWPGRRPRVERRQGFGHQYCDWTLPNVECITPNNISMWRGAMHIMEQLAHSPKSKVDKLSASISNSQFRDKPQDAIQAFSKIRDLDIRLDLHENQLEFSEDDPRPFNNHFLKSALARATSLENLRLEVNQGHQSPFSFQTFSFSPAIPLSIYDVGPFWSHLRTLELVKVHALATDLFNLFFHIRPTIEYIYLSEVEILRPEAYRGLLELLRQNAGFTQYSPEMVIEIPMHLQGDINTIQLWEDLSEFFGGGNNPFDSDWPHCSVNVNWDDPDWG